MESLPAQRTQKVFVAYGEQDQLIPSERADAARKFLEGAGYPLRFKGYRMGHETSPEVIADLRAWLREVLSGGAERRNLGFHNLSCEIRWRKSLPRPSTNVLKRGILPDTYLSSDCALEKLRWRKRYEGLVKRQKTDSSPLVTA